MMETKQNIFEFVTAEINSYQTMPIAVIDNYEWSMPEHIKKTVLYKNSQYVTGKNDNKPFKNIIRPILNLQYRAEGFDVKDILLFINDKEDYYKSFLVRKFHDKWAKDSGIDTFIDEMVESYVDFGGALIKDINEVRPEIVPWQSIAFCDQTDIMSGPLALKHFFAPNELKDMASLGWGDVSKGANATLDDVIALSKNEKKNVDIQSNGKPSRTPGKYIEVYEVHGVFPTWWLEDDYEAPNDPNYEEEYSRQLHIICYYTSEDMSKKGICLFKGKEKESIFKLILRDKIYGRALGFGGAEELFEPQVWVNYDVIRMKELLDMASKIIYQTADTAFSNRNKLDAVTNGEILIHEVNMPIEQINTQPVSIQVFQNSVREWEAHAQQMGAANDSIMGEPPTSGTPFKLQELVTEEAHSLHEYRKGKLATFLGEVYRDWIIPYIVKEITKGQEFLAELELDELQQVAEALVANEANDYIKAKILAGEMIDSSQVDEYKQMVQEGFMKGGNKRFIEILKGEMKDAPIDIEVNIVGKQKDLAKYTDKLVNIFRQVISSINPQTGQSVLDDPRMAKIFNEILESSGLSPIDFAQKPKQQLPPPQTSQPQQPVSPIPQLAPQPQ